LTPRTLPIGADGTGGPLLKFPENPDNLHSPVVTDRDLADELRTGLRDPGLEWEAIVVGDGSMTPGPLGLLRALGIDQVAELVDTDERARNLLVKTLQGWFSDAPKTQPRDWTTDQIVHFSREALRERTWKASAQAAVDAVTTMIAAEAWASGTGHDASAEIERRLSLLEELQPTTAEMLRAHALAIVDICVARDLDATPAVDRLASLAVASGQDGTELRGLLAARGEIHLAALAKLADASLASSSDLDRAITGAEGLMRYGFSVIGTRDRAAGIAGRAPIAWTAGQKEVTVFLDPASFGLSDPLPSVADIAAAIDYERDDPLEVLRRVLGTEMSDPFAFGDTSEANESHRPLWTFLTSRLDALVERGTDREACWLLERLPVGRVPHESIAWQARHVRADRQTPRAQHRQGRDRPPNPHPLLLRAARRRDPLPQTPARHRRPRQRQRAGRGRMTNASPQKTCAHDQGARCMLGRARSYVWPPLADEQGRPRT
jgi:hypothetical protein